MSRWTMKRPQFIIWGIDMEDKTVEGIPLNDGGGLMDNTGLINVLIVDCNTLPGLLFNGQYVGFCSLLAQMVQKLTNLKTGINNDADALKERIKELERLLAERG